MRTFFLASIFLLLSCLASSSFFKVSASSAFYTSSRVDYLYDSEGGLTVTHHITLKNQASELYATSFQIKVVGDQPRDVIGRDSLGAITITTTPQDPNSAVIDIVFAEALVGKNQSRTFSITYTGTPAERSGTIWHMTIPKLSSPDIYDQYEAVLKVAKSLGNPAYISPSPDSVLESTDQLYRDYTFAKKRLTQTGISAAFGNFNSLDFTLTYALTNPGSKPTTQSLVIPPDTPYQKVFYQSLNPKADSIVVDQNGNWLANYSLDPNSDLTVTAMGQVHLLASPQTKTALDPATRQYYLQPTRLWPSDDAKFIDLSKIYRTPKAIYDYVTSLGTQNAESTATFISIARAAGIPSRLAHGYNDSTRKPYTWPQYWDAPLSTWVAAGSTAPATHFTFSAQASDTNPPHPPDQATFSPGVAIDYLQPPLELAWDKPWQFLPFLSNTSVFLITNPSGVAVSNLTVSYSSSGLSIDSPPKSSLSLLPPFSHQTLPVSFTRRLLPPLAPSLVTISIGSDTVTYNIPQSAFIIWYVAIILTTSALLLALGFIANLAWHLHLQKHPR